MVGRHSLSSFAAALLAIILVGCAGKSNRLALETAQPAVQTGLDVLQERGFDLLVGERVGVIVNHSSINGEGEHLLDLLVEDPAVNVTAIFTPEHGIRGTLDEKVSDGRDEKTGLPIYSLYGQTRKPTPEMMAEIDVLIFDIQDIGARFYTYIATMGLTMEAAMEEGKRYVVLDRPNPIQGTWFDGPIQDDDLVGKFTAYIPMPTVHGMTIGEMARMYEKYYGLTPELDIVPMRGWKRDMYYDETGLPWVNPSPNMRSVDQELLYTMVAQTEGNKIVSVGRGTERPFEYLGAPWWKDGKQMADNMNARNLPGMWFMDTTFIPRELDVTGRKNFPYQFTEEVCHGIRIVVVDRHKVSPVAAGVHMLAAMRELYPETYKLEKIRTLVGAQWVLNEIDEGTDPNAIVTRWRTSPAFADFAKKRKSVLMY